MYFSTKYGIAEKLQPSENWSQILQKVRRNSYLYYEGNITVVLLPVEKVLAVDDF